MKPIMSNLQRCIGKSREEAEAQVEQLWASKLGTSMARKTVIFDDFMDHICHFATESLTFENEEDLIHQLSGLMDKVMRLRYASSAKDIGDILREGKAPSKRGARDMTESADSSIPPSPVPPSTSPSPAPSPELDHKVSRIEPSPEKRADVSPASKAPAVTHSPKQPRKVLPVVRELKTGEDEPSSAQDVYSHFFAPPPKPSPPPVAVDTARLKREREEEEEEKRRQAAAAAAASAVAIRVVEEPSEPAASPPRVDEEIVQPEAEPIEESPPPAEEPEVEQVDALEDRASSRPMTRFTASPMGIDVDSDAPFMLPRPRTSVEYFHRSAAEQSDDDDEAGSSVRPGSTLKVLLPPPYRKSEWTAEQIRDETSLREGRTVLDRRWRDGVPAAQRMLQISYNVSMYTCRFTSEVSTQTQRQERYVADRMNRVIASGSDGVQFQRSVLHAYNGRTMLRRVYSASSWTQANLPVTSMSPPQQQLRQRQQKMQQQQQQQQYDHRHHQRVLAGGAESPLRREASGFGASPLGTGMMTSSKMTSHSRYPYQKRYNPSHPHAVPNHQVDRILQASRRRGNLKSRGTTAPASSSMLWSSSEMAVSASMDEQRLYASRREHMNDLESLGTTTPFICRGWHGYQRTSLFRGGGRLPAERRRECRTAGGSNSASKLSNSQSETMMLRVPSRSSGRLVDMSAPFLREFELPTQHGHAPERFGILGVGVSRRRRRFQGR